MLGLTMFAGRAHNIIYLVRRLQPELGISNEGFDIRRSRSFGTRNMIVSEITQVSTMSAHANCDADFVRHRAEVLHG